MTGLLCVNSPVIIEPYKKSATVILSLCVLQNNCRSFSNISPEKIWQPPCFFWQALKKRRASVINFTILINILINFVEEKARQKKITIKHRDFFCSVSILAYARLIRRCFMGVLFFTVPLF